MDPFVMYLTVAVALIDAALAGILLLIYAREYSRIRAPFTLGLVMFAALFLGQNLLAAYGYLVLMVFLPDDVQPFMLAIMLLEALALGVMAYGAAAIPAKRPKGDASGKSRAPATTTSGNGAAQFAKGKSAESARGRPETTLRTFRPDR